MTAHGAKDGAATRREARGRGAGLKGRADERGGDVDALVQDPAGGDTAPGAVGEVHAQEQRLLVRLYGAFVALQLDGWAGNDWPVITAIAAFGSFVAYIYSAPPLKLKANGWTGTYALGSSYIALPWWCGHAMFNAGSISAPEVVLTILYSIAGLGIAIVNDFKSIEGDRALGMNSLPVAFGIDTAKWICVASIDVTQLGVAAYLWAIGETWYAAVLAGLVLPQMFSQISFLQDPVNNDVKYQAAAQPFLVFGILTTALAVGQHIAVSRPSRATSDSRDHSTSASGVIESCATTASATWSISRSLPSISAGATCSPLPLISSFSRSTK